MNQKLSSEIQAEQDHGRQKYGGRKDNFAHDDETPFQHWHDYIQDHNERASDSTPMERRQHLVKVAGLAVSAIEAFDRNRRPDVADALIKKHHPSGDVLTELKKYVQGMRDVSEKNRKEWEAENAIVNAAEKKGEWNAYHDVLRTIERLEAQLNVKQP